MARRPAPYSMAFLVSGRRAAASPVNLAEDDIERTQSRADIGKHRFLAKEIHRRKMCEAGRPDLAAIWLIGGIRDDITAERSFRRLDRAIDFAGRHMEAFGVKLEEIDQSFHRTLHFRAGGGHDLAILRRDRPLALRSGELFDALLHDFDRLAHLFHANDLPVVIVAVPANRNVEIHLLVAFIGLRLAQIPGRAGAAHHHAGKAPAPALLQADHADIDIALLEDAVVDEESLQIVAYF